jgi:hypothetical protein
VYASVPSVTLLNKNDNASILRLSLLSNNIMSQIVFLEEKNTDLMQVTVVEIWSEIRYNPVQAIMKKTMTGRVDGSHTAANAGRCEPWSMNPYRKSSASCLTKNQQSDAWLSRKGRSAVTGS